ncbi:hypothetical protein [Piscinibacterium candidicorallinum]|uniref:Uncharacterized protein n=1 Tax=Piscinibacterium candidicorallinum TaxID=1793872 RepID=A0ABV7H4S1_9BURK
MNMPAMQGPAWLAVRSPNARRALTWALVFIAAGVLVGLIMPMRPLTVREQGATDLLIGVLTSIMVYMWCRAEATERRVVPSGRFALWAAVLPPVFFPVYLYRTRAARAATLTLIGSVLYYIAINLLNAAAMSAVIELRT